MLEVTPTGFNIYIDSGSGFDFESADDTVLFGRARAGQFDWTSETLNNGQLYKFCVRSYYDEGGESRNTDYVSAVADSQGPNAITGLQADWEEI